MKKISFEENKQRIVTELGKKIPNLKCPVCQKSVFVLGGGFFASDLQQDLTQRQMGGVSIPTVPVICSYCGFVMEFAAGVLGLLRENASIENNEQKPPKVGEGDEKK